MTPWETVATAPTAEGLLELRKRGEAEFLIVIGGRVLMNSASQRSEQALARLALAGRDARRVLVGGLGMGFTLRAALDELGPDARVVVGEIDPTIVAWCKGPLAAATHNAIGDRRVTVELGDVAQLVARSRGGFDAILLDLYEGPYEPIGCFSPRGLADLRAALARGGVLTVWSEDAAPAFAKRLERAGFAWTTHRAGKVRSHVVYCATAR